MGWMVGQNIAWCTYSTHSGYVIVLLIVSIIYNILFVFMPCFILGTKIPGTMGFVDVRY
jgi:hypothetical protein